jgi:ATP-dependent RNA helicase DDX1
MGERRAALQAFKDGDVRFLLATDVAARGIDVSGLPFVVNITLPAKAEEYVHRVGRVGRAGRVGLAVTLVSAVPEKVWYSTAKGLKPWLAPDELNTRVAAEGGHAAWVEERALLKEVEARLGQPVEALGADLSLPAGVAARMAGGGGGERYGEALGGAPAFAKEVQARVAAAAPAVAQLAALEKQAQLSFFELKKRWNA